MGRKQSSREGVGVLSRRTGFSVLSMATVLATLTLAHPAASHPDQHGPGEGHLQGSGAYGNIELLGVERVTTTPGSSPTSR